MKYVDLPQSNEKATIHVVHGEIVRVGAGFARLTGYNNRDFTGKPIAEMMMSTLRLLPASYNALTADGSVDGYIFTASGKAREVTVSLETLEDGGVQFCLAEKPDSRIDERLSILEQLFQDEFMSVALYSVPDYIILKANRNYTDFLRQACCIPGEITGRSLRDHEAGCPALLEKLCAVVENGKVTHFGETRFVGANGQETYRIYTFQPIFVSGGMKYIVETSKDATERVREKRLQERYLAEIKLQNMLLTAVMENMYDALAIFSSEGKLSFVNARARDMYPYLNEDTTVMRATDGITCFDLNGVEIPAVKLPTRRAMNGETIRNECIVVQHRDSTQVIEVNAAPIFDEAGKLMSTVVTHHDMTALLQNQQLIQSKDDMLREKSTLLARQAQMLDLSNEAIFAWEPDGKIVYWNKGAERMYGFDSSETVGRYTVQLLKTIYIEQTPDITPHLEEAGEWRGILEHTTKAGDKILVESYYQCITDDVGEKLILEINRDITEHRKMEEALRESEMHYRMASVGYGAGVYAYDFLQKKGYWSEQYRSILGLRPEDVLPLGPGYTFAAVHPEDNERLVEALKSASDPAGGGILDITYRIIRADKAIRWVQSKGQTFFTVQGVEAAPYLAAGAVVDITDEKTVGDQIRRISEELTHIIESTDDFIWSVDRDRRIVFCNTAAREHFKAYYGRELSDAESVADLLPMRTAISIIEQIQQERLSDGAHFEFRTPIGGRVVSYSINPVYVGGECVEATVFGEDITERQNAEREIIRLNASLEERVAERTAQLQRSVSDHKNIALILSHDLKSALRGIGLYVGEILAESDIPENALKIKTIYRELLTMVDGLMSYEKSSWQTITKQRVNIRKIILSVFSELDAGAPSKGILEFETGMPPVIADSDSLRHAILNILSNALKFTVPGRQLRIDVGCRAEENVYVVYFRDNGIGFDMAYSEKIFGVFERLNSRNEYEGSGVGLAIVRNIIQRHGGRVWADSAPGTGTTIFMALPMNAIEDDECIK